MTDLGQPVVTKAKTASDKCDREPRVTPRGQILLAAIIRSTPGVILAGLGAYWLLGVYGLVGVILVVPFAGLGLAKASLLRRMASRSIAQARERGSVWIMCAISGRTVLLIVVMIALGRLLRASDLIPRGVLGLLYLAIGLGLLVSSVDFWGAWARREV